MAPKILSSLLLASLAAAVVSARNCKNLTIPLSLSAQNMDFTLKAPANDIEVTNFVLNSGRAGANYADEILSENKATTPSPQPTASPTRARAARCRFSLATNPLYSRQAKSIPSPLSQRAIPDSSPADKSYKPNPTQPNLYTNIHPPPPDGAAFDRTYWDFPFHAYNYSYANAALARNYSVFFFDRPGIGESTRGDPVAAIQSSLELSALRALTAKLRRGSVRGISARYERVVHVGHSYGSAQTYALTAAHPDDGTSDAVALTGFSQGLGTYVGNFLFGGNFVLAGAGYGPGYITCGDVSAVQTNFFAPDNFDPDILQATYATSAPTAVGELLTIGSLTTTNNSFTGPVLVITGERDGAFCGGNCYVSEPSIPDQTGNSFTNTTSFEAFVVPGAGHGLNLEYTAQATYAKILDFFDKSV
ncbi:alpha/beta-hydrolase [Daldinia vernicosa]|uniref:alpha/beta-hydrolase n=1 Tax=Daldinia vernicosa TaxID=114800 RepID=UPI0020072D2B|nr:alpha/beta-hydrolase [Daldinia vernicosa]KAI0852949.1 alpha/beta-hydrolase [Daldinia vernicosa]